MCAIHGRLQFNYAITAKQIKHPMPFCSASTVCQSSVVCPSLCPSPLSIHAIQALLLKWNKQLTILPWHQLLPWPPEYKYKPHLVRTDQNKFILRCSADRHISHMYLYRHRFNHRWCVCSGRDRGRRIERLLLIKFSWSQASDWKSEKSHLFHVSSLDRA